MLPRDAQGLSVAGAGGVEIEAVDSFRRELLVMNGRADGILAAAEAAPQCPLLQTYAALFCLYGGTEETTDSARGWIERAANANADASARESLLLEAARAWADADTERTMDLTESITRDFPRDLVAAKISEFQYYVGGQHYNGARYLAHMERIAPANEGDTDVLAMHAFALELCGRYDEARRMAEAAVEKRFASPWAHHALSHIAVVTGDVERGIREQTDFRSTWNNPGPSIHGHDAWHLAILHLANDDDASAWDLFHHGVWGQMPGSTGEQADAISLLWRMDMAGVAVPEKTWDEVAGACAPLADQAWMPFVTLHHAYALARAGRDTDLERLRRAARHSADTQPRARQSVWREVALPTFEGAVAFARGDMKGAAAALDDVAGAIPRLGGSDAQDDLFRLTLLTALRRLDRHDEARGMLPLFPGRHDRV